MTLKKLWRLEKGDHQHFDEYEIVTPVCRAASRGNLLFVASNCNFEMALFATQTEVFFNQSSMHLFSLLFQNVLDTEACNGYKRVNTHPLLPKASQGHAIARTRRKPHPT
ncbi:hypothetical protein [Desulfosarcina ovata]|uniref:hypothetical protein n=1 Tax=Desulfosarcina ovata TaxID=83564 RepID=UPI0012D31686|nr:hypothetical protein [Desulfosarcina ovata]